MLIATDFQILAPWYLIDFWHCEKENLGICRFFLAVDRVRRLWIEEVAEKTRRYRKEELVWNIGFILFFTFKYILISIF